LLQYFLNSFTTASQEKCPYIKF